MRLLLRSLLLLILPLAVRAQVTVRGTVVDQKAGTPVAGALVRAPAGALATTTSDSGTFTLTSARAIAVLTVSRVGYTTLSVSVPGNGGELRIALVASSVELPGVQVVAQSQAPSTAAVTRADLDRFNGFNLTDAINTVPGVFMQSRTPFGGAHITIRGYYPTTSGNSPNSNGQGYTVFLNHVPITDASGVTVLDDVDYSSLGNVEVIKGPASSLYGSPIGGTVNFTLRRPAPNQTSVQQEILGGGDGLLRSNTNIEHAGATSDFVLNYGHQRDNSFRPHSESRKDYVRANGDFAVGADQAVSAFFTYNRSYEELAGEIDTSAFYARRPESNPAYLANDSHIQLTSFFTGVTDNYRISDRFTNQTSLFGSGRFANQPFAHGFTDATQFNFGARSSFGFTGQIGSSIDVSGRLGAQAQRSQVTSNGVFIIPAPPFAERPSASQNYAVNSYLFTEWDFSFPGDVTMTVGADLIRNTFSVHNLLKNNQLFDTTATQARTFPTVLAPRVQLQKSFGGNSSVYGSVSTGYTPPLLANIISSDNSVNFGLKPEHAVQYEVGAQGSLLDQRLNGQVALFDIENANKLTTQTANTITSTTNIGKQRNTGAEVSASYLLFSSPTNAISVVRPWASYTYTDAKYVTFKSDNNNNAATVDFSGNAAARVPKTMVSAGLDASTRMGVYLASTYQFVGRVPVTFDNSTWVRSYNLLGAKLGYRTDINRYHLDLAVGGDNLTNSTYYTFLFVGPNYHGLAQAADGGTGDGYILPGLYSARYYVSANLSVPIM